MSKEVFRQFGQLLALLLFSVSLRAATSPAITISEIMFRPPGTNHLEQWFEVHNPTSKSVNLAGWKVTRGVRFTFPLGSVIPAHGYLVVAADLPTFRARHPEVANAVGGWTGKLGHQLELTDPSGTVVNALEFYTQGDWAIRRMGPLQYNRRGWEWFSLADGHGASLELVNLNLPNSHPHNWSANTATNSTPGRLNSVATNDAAPFISGVAHWPPVPASSNQVFVTARLLDELPATLTVALNWKVDGAPDFSQTPMRDDGTQQDGIAADGVFGAQIPAQTNRAIVEFFITASDAAGHTRIYPAFEPSTTANRRANLLYQVDDTPYTGSQPIYRLIMLESERAYLHDLGRGCPDSDSDAQMNGTWITTDGVLSGGTTTQVRYNIGIRNRGHGSRTAFPHNYHINIPEDRLWKSQAGLNLNSQYAHSQVLGSAVMRKAGLAMTDSRAVQLRVNSTNQLALGGNSFGSYAANEQFNNEFIKRSFPADPDGNAYRGIRTAVLCVPSLGGVADFRWHGPDWNVAGYTNAYFKENNVAAADFSDLHKLISILALTNGTTAETYVSDVRQLIDVEQWMTYMAASTLLDSTETSLANGIGDDYGLYRGAIDSRFRVLPYDMDSVMGRALTSSIRRAGIFQMHDLPAMERFMKQPEFAPPYFEALQRLADTVFSTNQMNPMLDHVLGGYVSPAGIEMMKAFNSAQRDYVLSQIPLSLTVTSALAQVNGYLQTTNPTLNLNGAANAIETRRVVINGADATWTAWRGLWSVTNFALSPGLNRLALRALGENGLEVGSTNIDIWFDDGAPAVKGGSLSADARWTAADGPYIVTSTLTVNTGATLTIDPGATIYLASGVNLIVANGGRLIAEGTERQPIRFSRAPGETGLWGGIVVNGGPGSPETRISYAHLEFNGTVAIHSEGGTVYLDHLTFGTTDRQYLSLDASSFIVSHCHFPTPTATFEPTHGGDGVKPGGHAIFFRNFFGAPRGYSDVLDFTGGQRGAGGILYFVENVMIGSDDDGLDLDGADAWIEGNIFMHIHRNGSPDSASAISGGSDSSQTSEITILRNLFFDCDQAATGKQGNFYTLFNNTVVRITKQGGEDPEAGVVNLADDGTTFGRGMYLEGNIIVDAEQLVRHYDPAQSAITFTNNILPTAWTGPGGRNYIGDPLLKHIPTLEEASFNSWEQAQIMWDWFSLNAGSPARRAGPAGQDQGAVVPPGVCLSGYPTGTNNQTSATISVGLKRTGYSIPAAGWPLGSGYTHYKWRLNDGPWSAETPIDTPISLTGLANGPHRVDVVGKSDAGLYQDDPRLSPSASVSSTGTWHVDDSLPSPAQPSIWINEILAKNSAVIQSGATPDLVEFHNFGPADLNLSGWHVTRILNAPFAFTFPPGTTLPAGAFLVVSADTDFTREGLHLGFNLDGDGDALYLLDASLAVVDSIAFGRQISNASIGRNAGGEWALCIPSFGAANIPIPLGDHRRLRLNEWLADREFAAADSFVEIFNPNSQPVQLSGLFLSDAVGSPQRFPFPPLSFIDANGFAVFAAVGNNSPGHLNFKLSPDVGIIALSAPDGVIDFAEYGPQRTDISEGRSPNGADFIRFFSQPTPGASNPGFVSQTLTNITRTAIEVVSITNSWLYHESGTDLGAAWRAPDFPDSSWLSGQALFYHGDDPDRMPLPIGTTVNFRSPQQITFYFRARFNYSGTLANATLTLTQVMDDGFVAYLNGTEVYRRNLPLGTIQYSTRATNNVSDATQFVATGVPAIGLLAGDNLLALELHQSSSSSSDIAMALGVEIVVLETNIVPNLDAAPAIVLNEILAKNVSARNPNGSLSDWIELFNPTTNQLNLADLSLTDDVANPRKWIFPPGSAIPPGSRLLLYCDADSPPGPANTGFNLNQDGGTIFIFDSPTHGASLLDSIRYGLQVANLSLGRVPDGTGDWTLATPTPNTANASIDLGSPRNLRLNEWMSSASNGSDWFEIFNPVPNPVPLAGLFLSDDLTDRAKFRLPPLSFVGAGDYAFALFEADDQPERGARHVNFKLSAAGEEIGLFDQDGAPIDSVAFGPQFSNISQGRLPDGAAAIRSFSTSASPEESNYLPIPNLVINEALPHPGTDFDQRFELHNSGPVPLDLQGWFFSSSPANLKQFRFTNPISLPANSYIAFTPEPGAPPFWPDAAYGGSLILSAATPEGELTGARVRVDFGPPEQNVSFGRHPTTAGIDFTALSAQTFAAPNAPPKISPVVITEIMYFPVANSLEDENLEFIELENISGAAQPLHDPAAPTNVWALRSAIRFDFPPHTTLAPAERILVLPFDPQNSSLLAHFTGRFSVPTGTRVFGPWSGRLNNSGESLQLIKPGPALAAAFPPEILADRVDYALVEPWPGAMNPGVDSLQRIAPANYGNEPLNWKAAPPTAGRSNSGDGPADSDGDELPDAWELFHFGTLARDGSGDFDGDRLSDRAEFLAGTRPNDALDALRIFEARATPTGVILRFQGVAGRNYRLVFTDNLDSPLWQLLREFPSVIADGVMEATDSTTAGAQARFYRLELF